MGGYYISSPRVVPEIWKREGVLFKKWVEIGSGYGRGWPGNFIDGIYYIIASWKKNLYSDTPSPCSYCGKKSNYYIRKYKSDTYNLKRRLPAQAKDLSIVDKLLIIIPCVYTKCSNCGGEHGHEENEFVKDSLNFETSCLTDRYDDESLLKMKGVLQNLDNWNVEKILIRKEDIFYSSD